MNLLRRILRKLFGSVVLAAVTLFGAPAAFGVTILAGLIFLPLPASIPVPKANPTVTPTVLYDRYGHPIAELHQFDQNIPFSDAQVPAILKEAVIADEDRNFYHEGGIDLRGTLRALVADLRNSAPVQGGSTITQQYVKLAYTNKSRTVVRKVREAILASQLARQASKEDILYHYLTVIYLGDGNYGAAAAAESYFHVPISGLDASQAATLAGLIPAPTSRAPLEHLPDAEQARELVLRKMFQQRYLTAAQYQQALSSKLALDGTPGTPPGATVVYRRAATPTAYPDFVDYVQRWLTANIPQQVLAAGGLRVQTTLDPAVQQAAYNAVNTTLSASGFPTDMALASVEPQTGFVSALYGGRDFGQSSAGQYEFDNLALGGCEYAPTKAKIFTPAPCWSGGTVTGGGIGRQPGSSFKPFTLATAFLQGIPPSTVFPAPYVYQIPGCRVLPGKPASSCQIHNDEGDIGGATSENLITATAQSTNTVYAQLASQVGCPNIASTAGKLGINSAYYATPPFYYCGAYSLGEVGVSPLDMASAYGVFADHGQRAPATPILEIVDGSGHVLVNNISPLPKTTSVLPSNVADNVTNILQGVIGYGTGFRAALPGGRPAAGKTGTTSNTTDAWFVGYTPTLSTAVWMGNVNGNTSIGDIKGCYSGSGCFYLGQVYGGTWPALTWKAFMSAALAKVPITSFTAPAPIVTPEEAAALKARATTTLPPVEPGRPGYVPDTPSGGPYVYSPPTPYAPPPAVPTFPGSPDTTTSLPDTGPTTTVAGGGPTTTAPTSSGGQPTSSGQSANSGRKRPKQGG